MYWYIAVLPYMGMAAIFVTLATQIFGTNIILWWFMFQILSVSETSYVQAVSHKGGNLTFL